MKYAVLAALLCPTFAYGQVNASISDGTRYQYAEGVFSGYTVQANGETICTDPLAYGRYIACSGQASKRVWVNTNGTLGAYIVVDQTGRALCGDPSVLNDFRGSGNLIVCN